MAQQNENRQLLRAAFALKIEQGADAAELAAVATQALTAVASRLNPIIGRAGVSALYKRSFHLTSLTYPWLASSAGGQDEIDLVALGHLLARQGVSGAAEAGAILLQTFCDLLASLVGITLTDRLLRSVWADL